MNNGQKGGPINPLAIWIIAAGAGAGGLTGFGSMAQLGQLNTTIEEQVRQAEIRGQLRAEIDANSRAILRINGVLNETITKDGALELHRAQQIVIDKILDYLDKLATKQELNLAIGKMRAGRKTEE